tara:strand:+ start:71 stop:190 length:120 start_codon:yes stop_codon:yes gene_type:complete
MGQIQELGELFAKDALEREESLEQCLKPILLLIQLFFKC